MRQKSNRVALKVALTYVIVALAWILGSDWLLKQRVSQPGEIILGDISKDSVFAILTALLLYFLLRRSLTRWERETEERRQAEAARRESEERYRKIFEVTTDAIFLVDCETTALLDANAAAEAMYGFSRDEFLRLKATDISAEPDETKETIAQETRHVLLRLHRRKNGEVFPVEILCSSIFFQNKKIHVAAVRDITERRRAEAAALLKNALLEAHLNSTLDGILIIDCHQKKILQNRRLVELFKIPQAMADDPDDRPQFEYVRGRVKDPEQFAAIRAHLDAHPAETSRDEMELTDGTVLDRYSAPVTGKNGQAYGRIWIFRDITARKRSEAKLRESEYFFKESQRAGRIGSFKFDFATGLWESSEVLDQIFGIDRHFVRTVPGWLEIVHEDDRSMMDEHLRETVVARHQPFNKEYRIVRPNDGLICWVSGQAEASFDQAGAAISLIGTVQDITARKRAESALQLSDFSMEQALLPTLWVSKSARIVRANRAVCDYLGYTASELRRLAITDLDPNFPAERWPAHWEELRARKHLSFETSHRHKSGRIIPVEVNLNWFEFGGEEYDFAFVRDITERKQAETALRVSEEKFRRVFENAIIGVAILLPDGTFVETNAAYHAITGYSLAELQKLTFKNLVHPDDLAEKMAVVQKLGSGEIPSFTIQSRYVKKGGATVWVRKSVSAVRDATGEIASCILLVEDITHRMQAEAALVEKERLLRTVIDLVPHAIFAKDRESRHLFANQACAAANGMTPEQMIGRCDRDFLPDPAQAEAYMRDDREVIDSGQAKFVAEEPFTDAAGRTRILQTTKIPFAVPGVAGPALMGVAIDITESKRAEQKILESRATLEAALSSMVDAVFISDINGNFTAFNDAFATFHRFRDKTECLKSLAEYPDILEVFSVNGKPVPLNLWAVPRALRGEVASNAEYTIRRKDTGETWSASCSFGPIRDRQGAITGCVVVARDITESKRAAGNLLRLATAVEQAAEAILITDTRGIILYVNPAFERITGYSVAEAVGNNPRILKSGKHDAEHYHRMWQVLARGEIWSGRFTNRRKDGTLFEEEATISPIRDDMGKIMNYVAVKRDVTREIQLEGQFRQAQKMEAIGTLAGGIAHDFNNILAAMFGFAHLLQEDVAGNAAAGENIGEILNAAGRARDLVQQILTFSRQREQKRQVIRLHIVVKEAVKFLRSSLPAGIKIDLELDAEAPAVLADPTQIYQVILNLGTNAFHAMEGRNGELRIGLAAFEPDADFIKLHPEIQPGTHVRLRVADGGLGMDAATLEHIFEPFFTTKPVGKGTGLGLSVVHGIVKSHEGLITVESVVDQGTTFCLYFPGKAEEIEPVTSPVNSASHGCGQHILVVDDERTLTAVFKKLLSRLGYQVTVSNSPQGALEMFRQNPGAVDLVITDLTMPDMNGVELARNMNALRPELPILLASGFNAGLDPVKLRETGIRTILQKPVSMATLSEALTHALKGEARDLEQTDMDNKKEPG